MVTKNPLTPPPPEPLKNLEARGGMTAIRVLWDPTEYSYYYRVEVHKAPVDDLGEAFLAGTTQGNIYSDVVGSDTSTWYYWARVVKQVGDLTIIGPWNQTQGTPANAASDPDWILGDLEGKIDDTHLNDRLSGSIDKIPDIERDVSDMEDSIRDIELDISELDEGLNTEIIERKEEDEQLHSRIDTNVSRIDDNAAAIVTESETRATETEALANQITTLVAEVDENRAAIQTESEVRATEDEALASRITTMQVEVDGNKAAIQTESEVRASEDEVLAKRIDTQTARIDDNAAAIQTESEVRASEDEALAKQITTLAAEVDENSAAIETESEVRASEDEVLASNITTLRADMDDASAAIRDEMTVIIDEGQKLASRVQTVELDLDETKGAIETRMEAVENELGEIRLEYTVIVDNDGYAGGFGIINEDGVIAALWRVDTFAIGSPGEESLAFAVDDGRTVMDGAYIKDASINTAQIGSLDVEKLTGDTATFVNANIVDGSITNAKIGNYIESDGFETGVKGWHIGKTGIAEFNDVVVRGTGEFRGTIYAEEIIGDLVSAKTYKDKDISWDNNRDWFTINSKSLTVHNNTGYQASVVLEGGFIEVVGTLSGRVGSTTTKVELRVLKNGSEIPNSLVELTMVYGVNLESQTHTPVFTSFPRTIDTLDKYETASYDLQIKTTNTHQSGGTGSSTTVQRSVIGQLFRDGGAWDP